MKTRLTCSKLNSCQLLSVLEEVTVKVRGLFSNTFVDSKGPLNFASQHLENMSLRFSLING